MPRFYFDLTEGGVSVPDDEGVMASQLDDAEFEAAVALAELLLDGAKQANQTNFQVLIRDETRAPVARVTLTLERERLS